ncbi:hypothetical protein [Catellatospora sp. NPDC049133]|uniref:hypothetical protein n=1 Tax=Catellatospora sp. NPDC049133 TaxID=3155499 RepID=UPI0033F0B6D9
MTRKVNLPSGAEVEQAKTSVLAAARATGTRPTVVALAGRLGMSNPTFWRHFPDIARELAQLGRTGAAQAPDGDVADSRLEELKQHNARLRRANQTLTEQLEFAVASIQRLAIDNHQLRQELETATRVTHIRRRG